MLVLVSDVRQHAILSMLAQSVPMLAKGVDTTFLGATSHIQAEAG